MGGEAECSAPSVFEAVPVFDDAVEVLDLHTSVVAFLPGGCAVWELLIGAPDGMAQTESVPSQAFRNA